jgi:hypothetical protein
MQPIGVLLLDDRHRRSHGAEAAAAVERLAEFAQSGARVWAAPA